jgi:hypothetical protein
MSDLRLRAIPWSTRSAVLFVALSAWLVSGCQTAARTGVKVTTSVLIAAAEGAASELGRDFTHRMIERAQPFPGAGGQPDQGSVDQLQGVQPYSYSGDGGLIMYPNIYGGWWFYDRTGRPVGFSVWSYGQQYFFDPYGNPMY